MSEATRRERSATGSIAWRRNPGTGAEQWHARLTLNDGSRRFVPLDPSIAHDEAARALPSARGLAAEAKREVRK